MELALNRHELNRVRSNTPPDVLDRIDARIACNIRFYAAQPREIIARRITELEKEWSIERWLEVNASTIGFTTSVLALTGSKKWGLLTCVALGFLLLHALQGSDPPLPLLRQMGTRTRGEIDRELYALKAVRGDFPGNQIRRAPEDAQTKAEAALGAVTEKEREGERERLC